MLTRISATAALLAMVFGIGLSSADATGNDHECQFKFKFHNPVLLTVRCVDNEHNDNSICPGGKHEDVDVYTNACTKVSWNVTPFVRQETDCEGKKLNHYDRITACTCMTITPYNFCQDPSPYFSVDGPVTGNFNTPNSGTATVDSHNGGYRIHVRVIPANIELCDDNGCYVSTVTITVSAIPNEDCHDVDGTDTGHQT